MTTLPEQLRKHADEWPTVYTADRENREILVQAAERIEQLEERIKELEDKRTEVAARNLSNMLYVEGLHKRIKRLEDAGYVLERIVIRDYGGCYVDDWRKAKEAKP